ncbi:MAG: hypothetical protein BWK73_51120 [Thiothrix lacustris]|uniref:DNA primase/helicase Gp4 N-terminal Bacteriophage T7-like domain-containing protein n=1 Tax=Thiothrix lacustris TaxID=525917 RepID=A0A1Y1Q8A1_9GAMM|nr:MAG: hypothetical protein BWK73_51120 [Thiothrix lacustris]
MAGQYRYSLEKIKPLARGRWLFILPALSGDGELFTRASQRMGKIYQHTPCPVCGGTDRFGLLPDAVDTGAAHCQHCGGFPDGFDLLQKIHGWSLPWALQQVAEYIGGGACAEPVARDNWGAAESRGISPEKQDARRKAIGRILAKCQREPSEIHRAYFQNRGIPAAADIRSASLLYHHGLPYYVNGKPLLDGKGGWKTWAAIVGRVSSSSGWMGLQRVYLTKDGRKADDEIMLTAKENGLIGDFDSKPMLSINGMVGGAVRFGKAGKVLAAGEGIETMLAVSIGLGGFMSVAAAGTAALLEGLEIPEQVETLLILPIRTQTNAGHMQQGC